MKIVCPRSLKINGWIAMLLFCRALALAATDPFLVVSTPSFTSNQVEFTLTGEASVSYVIESSTDLQSWSPLTTNTSPEIVRLVTLETNNNAAFYRVWRKPLPMFAAALAARLNISFNSNSIQVDSYDSGDPNHSTPAGMYDPATRKAGGDVASAEGFIDVGNADVKGKLYTGPVNAGQYSLGTNGAVGDLGWNGPGIQPGWYDNHFRFALPDVAPPYPVGLPPTGSVTNLWVLNNNAYKYDGDFSANSGQTIYVADHATVYVTGNFSMRGEIIIGTNAILKLYVGGTNTVMNKVSTVGKALSFQYYGLPTNKGISWGGNDAYVGTVYAPQASMKLGGGGSNPLDFQGACVVESVVINGHVSFHYDEALKRGPQR